MRYLAAGLLGLIALGTAGCGTSGTSVPGSAANASGGGAPLSGTQKPSASLFPPLLIDGGIVATAGYTGVNVTATDTQSTLDAGADTFAVSDPPLRQPPQDPAGSHQITFSTTVPTLRQVFRYSGQVSLTYDSNQAGTVPSTVYPAIALYVSYANANITSALSPTLDLEIYGGVGTTQYDARIACISSTSANPSGGTVSGLVESTTAGQFARYTCALPTYGSPSGLYVTSFAGNAAKVTYLGATLAEPAIANASGPFTPTNLQTPGSVVAPVGLSNPLLPNVNLLFDESGAASSTTALATPLPPITNGIVDVDYAYAEPAAF